MYKDKDKQREAVKVATRRYRAKNGDSALSGSKRGSGNARGSPVVDKVSDTQPVIPPKVIPSVIPKCDTQDKPRPPGVSADQWAYIQMKAEQDGMSRTDSTKGAGL